MSKSLFALFFLTIMTVMGGASVALFIKNHAPERRSEERMVVEDVPRVRSFAELYPFPDSVNNISKKPQEHLSALYNYRQAVYYAQSALDVYTKDMNPLLAAFGDLTKWYDESSQEDIILYGGRAIVRLSNGYLTSPYPYSHPTESWNNLLDFVTWLRTRDIQFLSMISADKGDDSFGTIPEGVPVGYSRMAEEYKAFHEQHGIAYLESKPCLLAQDSNFYYWFYKADHHWNVHAGRLMAEETAKRLHEMNLTADTNAAMKRNFTLIRYPDCFVGSYSNMLGGRFKEDLEVYYPKVRTRFHIEIPGLGVDREGSFDSTLIVKQNLPGYGTFLYGDQPLIRIENMLSDNDTRALVIKQSKAEVYNPYLALAIRHLDIIDPRHFDGSIRAFIEQTKPDIVITCVDVIWEGDEKFWRLR